MDLIISVLLGGGLGALIVWIKFRKRLKTVQELDRATANENIWLQEENNRLQTEIVAKNAQKEEIIASIGALQEQSKQAAEAVYNAHIAKMEERFSNSAESLGKDYQETEEKYQAEYLSLLEESTKDFQDAIATKTEELNAITAQIANLKAIHDASVEAYKRAQEMKEKENFYKLNLPQADILEIERLREVTPYLRDSEPLNKVIWKVYYEKAYTDLIGRVVGSGVHTGIYKITNLKNGMCYIGQAVNIADRWRQHIKRGIGAESTTRNKLYPAMLEYGVENFSFEIVEECGRDKLNDREQYWQEHFKAKEFGYSIK